MLSQTNYWNLIQLITKCFTSWLHWWQAWQNQAMVDRMLVPSNFFYCCVFQFFWLRMNNHPQNNLRSEELPGWLSRSIQMNRDYTIEFILKNESIVNKFHSRCGVDILYQNCSVGEFIILLNHRWSDRTKWSHCLWRCRGGVRADRSMIGNAVLVWEAKTCQAAEILMVWENCVAIFFLGCRHWYVFYHGLPYLSGFKAVLMCQYVSFENDMIPN